MKKDDGYIIKNKLYLLLKIIQVVYKKQQRYLMDYINFDK